MTDQVRKVVINACYGGFGLSREAFLFLRGLKHPMALAEPDIGEKWPDWDEVRSDFLTSFLRDIPRDDPLLVAAVEMLGERADGQFASLRVVEIPADVEWEIQEYDGNEHIAEKHRAWY